MVSLLDSEIDRNSHHKKIENSMKLFQIFVQEIRKDKLNQNVIKALKKESNKFLSYGKLFLRFWRSDNYFDLSYKINMIVI